MKAKQKTAQLLKNLNPKKKLLKTSLPKTMIITIPKLFQMQTITLTLKKTKKKNT